jgi:hypothetical protein
MNNLKYLEIVYYKIIIDLLKTLVKYNFSTRANKFKIKEL